MLFIAPMNSMAIPSLAPPPPRHLLNAIQSVSIWTVNFNYKPININKYAIKCTPSQTHSRALEQRPAFIIMYSVRSAENECDETMEEGVRRRGQNRYVRLPNDHRFGRRKGQPERWPLHRRRARQFASVCASCANQQHSLCSALAEDPIKTFHSIRIITFEFTNACEYWQRARARCICSECN